MEEWEFKGGMGKKERWRGWNGKGIKGEGGREG
jgi:hypothetical protein